MSAAGTICSRELGRHRASVSSCGAVAAFLAVSGTLFAHFMMRGDGGSVSPVALWSAAAAVFLPALAALLTAGAIAAERIDGRFELTLAAGAAERDVVLGKFFASWTVCMFALVLGALAPMAVLPRFAPALAPHLSWPMVLPALFALALQAALWCACGTFASACFRPPMLAALASLLLTVALPHAAFRAVLLWMPSLRERIPAMPVETHAIEMATGLLSASTVAFYVLFSGFALFAAVSAAASVRLAGRGGWKRRTVNTVACVFAFVFACVATTFVSRLDFSVEIPLRAEDSKASARTRQILADMNGRPVEVTCFLARKAPEFRAVARLLRGLEAAARRAVGARLTVRFVDPRWELGEAARLVRQGMPEGTIEFRRGRRTVRLPVASVVPSASDAASVAGVGVFAGETVCASALQRLNLPAVTETVYWTVGHGESSFSSYDPEYGMSDIARELMRDGYMLKTLDLASSASVPEDCTVLVVAGARDPFSRAELQRLDGFLRGGGRLLAMVGHSSNSGAGALLADWGVRKLPFVAVSPHTLGGTDVLVKDFANHPVTRPLSGGTVVFDRAVVLEANGAAVGGGEQGASDRTGFTALASTDALAWGESDPATRPWIHDPSHEPRGPLVLAAALERGTGVSRDLAIRPTRIVAIGDAAFVSNGALARRANANRDFFLNSVAWLAGLDALTAARSPGDAVATGLDRPGWIRFAATAAAVPSLAAALLFLVAFWRRRRRTAR